ncbi:MAG: 50S ribosomal protein L21 [Candidatus Levybacteria bacterium]|nr:50S ribosomal protein L21 [Candidatus Levybacteria bacterium]
MKYSVIQSGGKQYRVSEGDIIQIDKLPRKEGEEVVFSSVLLYVSDGAFMLGKPYIKDLTVSGKLIRHTKGEKLRIAKFKAKARYRRVTGFRSSLSEVKIGRIGESILAKDAAKETRKKKSVA